MVIQLPLLRLLVMTTTVRAGNSVANLHIPTKFFSNDPLWDGQQCPGAEAPCCTHPNMPWFNKTLSETTTEDIELRVCAESHVANEDTPLQLFELFSC